MSVKSHNDERKFPEKLLINLIKRQHTTLKSLPQTAEESTEQQQQEITNMNKLQQRNNYEISESHYVLIHSKLPCKCRKETNPCE